METEFEAFVGLKPLSTVAELLELKQLAFFRVSSDSSNSQLKNTNLREIVCKLLTLDADTLKSTFTPSRPSQNSHSRALIARYLSCSRASQIFLPKTPASSCPAHLDYLVLQPGQCLYIPAYAIHAYLSGYIIDYMARSDNVLNIVLRSSSGRYSAGTF